mgnify:CR=1 FL=1
MAWMVAQNVPSGIHESAYGIFGYQLQWKDKTVAQAWDSASVFEAPFFS